MIMDEDCVHKAHEARANQAELRIRILQKALDSEILKNKELKDRFCRLEHAYVQLTAMINDLHKFSKSL